jgi:hypothetical protein
MLEIYDLYDMHEIFLMIRFCPDYELNCEVLIKIKEVLKNRHNNHEGNRFRRALRTIESLDKELYDFVFVDNKYTYHPSGLKNEKTCNVLSGSCECLLKAVEENDKEKCECKTRNIFVCYPPDL